MTLHRPATRRGYDNEWDSFRLKRNKLFLYTQKTGTPVYVPLSPAAVEALNNLNATASTSSPAGSPTRSLQFRCTVGPICYVRRATRRPEVIVQIRTTPRPRS